MNDRKYFYTTLFSYQSNTTNTTLLSCFISLRICSNGSRKGQYVLYEYEEDVGSQRLSPSPHTKTFAFTGVPMSICVRTNNCVTSGF